MAYRDPLESRRARLERLEDELEALKADEALLQRLPSGGGLMARVIGSPKVLERALPLERAVDAEELAARANEAFEIEGRIAREGETLVWRAEPEPRPRRLVVRVEPDGEGAILRVHDERRQRSMVVLIAFLAMLPYVLRHGAVVVGTIGLVGVIATFLLIRRQNLRATRRRLWQAERLARALTAPAPVRVSSAAEEVDAHEDVDERDAEQPRRADRKRAQRG